MGGARARGRVDACTEPVHVIATGQTEPSGWGLAASSCRRRPPLAAPLPPARREQVRGAAAAAERFLARVGRIHRPGLPDISVKESPS